MIFIVIICFLVNINIQSCCTCDCIILYHSDTVYIDGIAYIIKKEFSTYYKNKNEYLDIKLKPIFDNIIDVNQKSTNYTNYIYHNKEKNANNLFIFFHPAFVSIFHNYYTSFEIKGFDILLPEYPGFSINSGYTDEKAFDDLIDNLCTYLQDLDYKNIVIAGHSFGCHLALKLALKLNGNEKLKGIILVCPFKDIKSCIWKMLSTYTCHIFPWLSVFIKKRFDNLELIKQIVCPITIMYSKKDELCSLKDQQELFNSIESEKKEMKTQGEVYKSHFVVNFPMMKQIANRMVMVKD